MSKNPIAYAKRYVCNLMYVVGGVGGGGGLN